MKKIDIHVHSRKKKGITSLDGNIYPIHEELRNMYDRLGIEKGVNLPFGMCGCEGVSQVVTNEEAHELAIQHPNTYYWFCGIDPRWGYNSPDTDFTHYINYYKALGAKGVGELTANLYFDDPRVLNLLSHCEKCNMPVTFHIGHPGFGGYGVIDELSMPRLEKVLNMFPKLILLGHSAAFWAEISSNCTEKNRREYPKGKVSPGGRVVELMRQYPNLHGDLSAESGYNALTRDPDFGFAFLEEFQDRLYFGTDFTDAGQIDYPMANLSHWLDQAVNSENISKVTYEKVCRGNALKLLDSSSNNQH